MQIKNQIWMSQNLAYAPFITYVYSLYQLDDSGIYCYDDDSVSATKHNDGFLYSWDAAINSCPAGWHLPTKEDFETLIYNIGIDKNVVYKALIEGGDSGFEGSMCGYLSSSHNFFSYGNVGFYWTATERKKKEFYLFILNGTKEKYHFSYSSKGSVSHFAYSVRCIKD
jgi:uncharacterized protein (TIGR02145 family)